MVTITTIITAITIIISRRYGRGSALLPSQRPVYLLFLGILRLDPLLSAGSDGSRKKELGSYNALRRTPDIRTFTVETYDIFVDTHLILLAIWSATQTPTALPCTHKGLTRPTEAASGDSLYLDHGHGWAGGKLRERLVCPGGVPLQAKAWAYEAFSKPLSWAARLRALSGPYPLNEDHLLTPPKRVSLEYGHYPMEGRGLQRVDSGPPMAFAVFSH